MVTSLLERSMGKKQSAQSDAKQKKPATSTTRLDVELLRQARVVSSYHNIDLYDYLTNILADRVKQDYDGIVKK